MSSISSKNEKFNEENMRNFKSFFIYANNLFTHKKICSNKMCNKVS